MNEPLDYLVIAPHPDDAELGAGGTISVLLSQGRRVGVLDLTDGEPTPFGSPEIRARETAEATAVLGLSWRGNLGLIERATPEDLKRVGVHAERGEESAGYLIGLYAGHDLLHLNQLARIRRTVT